MILVTLVACNHAPSEWPDASLSPDGKAPWGHPTETACDNMDDPEAFEVDGFTFCGRDDALDKTAVDDPIYGPCDTAPDDADGRVFAVFDGVRARGWSIPKLIDRELVNDDWGGEPILVDY